MTAYLRMPLLLVALMLAPAAFADEDHCRVPMADWQPRPAVESVVEKLGLTVRRIKIDDGCYEVDAVDAAGQRVRLRLDPGTLAVLRRGDRHGHGHGEEEDEDDD